MFPPRAIAGPGPAGPGLVGKQRYKTGKDGVFIQWFKGENKKNKQKERKIRR